MKRILINGSQNEEIRVSSVDGQKLYDLDIQTSIRERYKGNIYKAVVTRIEPSLEAAFVNYGRERHGFLPLKEISKKYLKNETFDKNSSIKDMLEVGQTLIAQVEREERGNKGAAMTTFASLAGKYLVLMPNNPKAGGVSRRIEGNERNQVKSILNKLDKINDGGVIVRTAGVGKSQEELQWDQDYLVQLWDAIQKASKENKDPFLIYRESDIIIRTLRDHMDDSIEEILVDDKNVFEKCKEFLDLTMPHQAQKLKLYEESTPLFSKYQIENQIESAFSREVILPSGGSIVIDQTEALTAIDINSARSTKGSDIEETALNTNIEAAEEIAKQLRIRDLGGLLVIDFIDMLSHQNQKEVENKMRDCVRLDKARVQVGKISRFGLLELSRQRLRPSLRESSESICPRCGGTGRIRNTKSIAPAIIRLARDELVKEQTTRVVVELPLDISAYIINEKSEDIANLKVISDAELIILPNNNLERPNYKISRYREDNDEFASRSSFEISTEEKETVYEKDNNTNVEKAAVDNIVPESRIPISKNKEKSLFKKIISFFAKDKKEEKNTGKRYRKSYKQRNNRYNKNKNYYKKTKN